VERLVERLFRRVFTSAFSTALSAVGKAPLLYGEGIWEKEDEAEPLPPFGAGTAPISSSSKQVFGVGSGVVAVRSSSSSSSEKLFYSTGFFPLWQIYYSQIEMYTLGGVRHG
jgi:hypothetical protein